MKIIHTADWHLCDWLGPKIDRTPNLETRVKRVAALCEEHAADVLLIAGDLFSEQASSEQMTRALTHMRETFKPFFARNGTILAITGNHDNDERINMVRAGMTLAAPVAGQDGNLPSGRMYLVNGRVFATLVGADGQRVQFVLVPYPRRDRYDLSKADYQTKEEENRLLHGRVAEWVKDVVRRPGFDVGLPTVLAAHLQVRGAELGTLTKYTLTDRDDVLFDFADLNPCWAYIALGHIHLPQMVSGQANVQYPGSLDRLAFDETHDDHGVLLVQVGRSGMMGEPVRLPIAATPFHTITITDPEVELPELAGKFPDHETAIVRVMVTPTPTGPSRDEISRELRRVFPRLHELKWTESGRTEDASNPTRFVPKAGFAATVRDYLGEKLKDESDKDAILALADTFLADGGET